MRRASNTKSLITLNQILRAWQSDEIDYRTAMDLAQVETLDELYDAAMLSNVPLRTTLTEAENRQADFVAEVIRQARYIAA